MAYFWEKYFNTFKSTFSRDLSKESPNPSTLSGAGIGRADGMGTSEYLEGGSTFTHSVEVTSLNDFLEIGEHTDRRARYLEYDRLENVPEISSCITKDSVIQTVDGDFTIEQLLEMYPNGESFGVYCFDEKTSGLTIGNAHSVRWTKKDIIYEVKLNNEKSIKCTGDHKFLLRNGEWKEAKDLKPNDRLMPCDKNKNHSVISVENLGIEEDVYDLTTDVYHNFACNEVIIHNCLDTYSDETTTPDIEGKVFTIVCNKQEVKEELEWLFYELLDIETEALWSWTRNLCKNGDLFLELVIDPDNPELGVQKVIELPPETIYRIETVRGRILEFQQSYLGPDYQVVLNDINNSAQSQNQAAGWMPGLSPMTTVGSSPVSNPAYMQSRSIRFTTEQVVHVRIGINRRGFYPYGVSVLYPARRIAHLLKLMEDAMVIYRLTRSTERRVFYIDVGSLPPNKGELVVERMKDKIKKKKIFNRSTGSIDERYNPWSVDEDFFIATRPESNTRIETLPGASALGEVDDTKYFREKLMVALKLPKNYLFQEDVNINRTSYATQDMRFARTIYRIQKFMAEGLRKIAIRHLILKGFPEEDTRNIRIKFTQPSDWMEISRSEILNNRYNLASSIKGGQIYDDYSILTKILKHTPEEALDIISRFEKQLLRQQEIQAQAQVFAQLSTPVQEQPPIPPGESPQPDFGGIPEAPQFGQQSPLGIPEAPQFGSPQEIPPSVPQVQPKKQRIRDFDELDTPEEGDSGYDDN